MFFLDLLIYFKLIINTINRNRRKLSIQKFFLLFNYYLSEFLLAIF